MFMSSEIKQLAASEKVFLVIAPELWNSLPGHSPVPWCCCLPLAEGGIPTVIPPSCLIFPLFLSVFLFYRAA